ncbi:MAG: hypothetical protein EOP88_19440 [Verrucomicrobiaceae bacterium]|nr:MAG: hypothetical protein EOP88_19440 [Verrucomicrobiaceae bacterium]
MRLLRLFLLSTPLLCQAEPATVPEWVAALAENYQKQEGHIAVYHSEGKDKSLDVTLATDPGSGLAVLHVISSKEGQRMEIRQWSTEPGDFFIDANGRRGHVLGLKEEIKALADTFTDDGGKNVIGMFTPELLLTGTEVSVVFGMSSRPAWENDVEGAKLGKVTDESVTFITSSRGELTVSRETGLVTRQFIVGENNEQRVLELVRHQKNPGQEALVALTRGWTTEGAEPIDNGMLKNLRFSMFQSLVEGMDEDPAHITFLKERLESHREQLEAFAVLCYRHSPDSKLVTMDWEKLVRDARVKMRKAWEEKVPEADRTEENFEKTWSAAKTEALATFQKLFERDKNLRTRVLQDLFGRGNSLKATTDAGREAKELIESGLCGAFLKEVIRSNIGRHWDAPPSE